MIKTFKHISYRTYSPSTMKLDMERYELKLYTVYVNDDPELTVTYFTAISNLAKLVAALKTARTSSIVQFIFYFDFGISRNLLRSQNILLVKNHIFSIVLVIWNPFGFISVIV